MLSKANTVLSGLFLAILATPAASIPEANPAPAVVTSAPELEASSSTRVTTSFYSFVTTQIPRDEHSIGMGLQREGTDEYYWLYCINDPFTTKSGFAGCGEDDLYTACSGSVATGIDGGEILCDHQCVTHKVFADLDVTTFTPLIGCGKGTSTMNLLRTSTGTGLSASSDATPTGEEEESSSTTASSTADSAGHSLRCGSLSAGLIAAAFFFL